jgi:hypothetical protein
MNTITEGKYIDLFVTYRFLRILTIPWEDQEAFKLGIIDGEGKRIKEKKVTSSSEKDAYTMLHRMVFNFKRILSKIPLVKSKLGTYAAALFLLKEHMKEDEYNLLVEYISETGKFDDELEKNINKLTLTEALCLLKEENMNEVALKEAKRMPAKVSNLGPEGQFALINDFLGIRQASGIQPFRKDPKRADKIIKARDISDADVKLALSAMEKEDWFMVRSKSNSSYPSYDENGKKIKEENMTKKLSEDLDEAKFPWIVIDTDDDNKVVAMASDESDAKDSIRSAERPPMNIKDKSTLKIVKTRKKQYGGMPLVEDAPTNNMGDGKIAKKDNVMKMDGRSKNFKSVMRRIKERKLKEQERLMKAKLLKWGIKEGVVNEEEYEEFFKKAMKKFKIKDIEDLNDKERVKFFNWVDKNWDAGENETD